MNKKTVLKAGIITALLYLIFYKRNLTMGVITENSSIDNNIVDVVKTLGGGLNAALLLAETCSVESDYGNNIFGDVGIMQFTTVGFNDTKARTSYENKNKIFARYRINIDTVILQDLQFSPLKSIIFARLFYLLRSGTIPATIQGRAAYWKKYYNSSLGAGTEEQYIKKAKSNPRPNIIKAFS
jgi:hypothetical protein